MCDPTYHINVFLPLDAFREHTLRANSFFIDSSSKDFRSISCLKTSKSSAILSLG